jgi:hypothetical protein
MKIMDVKLIEYIKERSENIQKYSDKLTVALKEIDSIITEVIDVAKVSYTDDTYLLSAEGTEYRTRYYLKASYSATNASGLKVIKTTNCEYIPNEANWIFEAPKNLQRAAIKRLPEFLEAYGKHLEERENDYKECAKLANSILVAITPEPKVRKYRYGSVVRD